jgi:hypothetical protein
VEQVLKQLNDRREDAQFFDQTISPHVLQALSSDLTTTESCHHYQSFYQPPLPDSVMHQGKHTKKGKKGKGKKGKGAGDEEEDVGTVEERKRLRKQRRQQRQAEGAAGTEGAAGAGADDGAAAINLVRAKAKAKANTLKQRKMMRMVLQQTEGLVKKDGLYHR